MHLNIFVSQRCYTYCKGCYSYSREEKCGQHVPTDKIIDFLKYAHKEGISKVTLCGGDPLTRNDIISLLKKIKSLGYYISLDTLGSSIIKNVKLNSKTYYKKISAKDIANLVDMIGIPIDGSTNEKIKLFRQSNTDIVNEQIEICNELNKYGANICINTVLHKGNLDDIKNLANLIKKMDYIKKWQIFQFLPVGKFASLNRNQFEINDEDFINTKNDISNLFDNKEIVQFKNPEVRDKLYILVDNSGNAWVSSACGFEKDKREIIGNITNPIDWPKITSYLKA